MSEGKINQCLRVVQYMEQFGSISRMEAFEDLRIANLPARITDLIKLGYNIKKEKIKYFVNGVFTHYTRYSIEK